MSSEELKTCADELTSDNSDVVNGLKQLEQLISQSEEYQTNQKVSFNSNRLLNDLLDKPIGDDSNAEDASDAEDVDSSGAEDVDDVINDDEEEMADDEEEDNSPKEVVEEQNGVKEVKTKNKRKKSRNPGLRKNIKSILKETELDLETQLARKEEEERIARQRERSHQRWQELQSQQIQSPFDSSLSSGPIVNSFSQSFSDITDVITIDDEEDKQNCEPNSHSMPYIQPNSPSAEVIDLTSDEESPPTQQLRDYCNTAGAYDDDDVSILDTTTDALNSDNFEDQNNCGSHTDDAFNTPNDEGKVVVNVAHPPDDPDIHLAPQIAQRVKPHQIGGIRFLYDNVVESLERYKKSSGFGCILSHSMGLGKTMQVIAFIDVFLSQTNAKHILCIVPINTLQNWISEFDMWLPEAKPMDKFFKKNDTSDDCKYRTFRVFAVNEAKSTTTRAKEILSWRKFGGVLLLGYEMYRILTSDNKSKSKKDEDIDPKILDQINSEVKASLVDPGPDLVVCDEGHRIKNCNAATSQALKNIKTKRRIVLTGYPLQNKLLEYWCMVDFVRPNYLGLKNEFINMFERPITNGQCSDSTPHDRKIMKYRAHVLYQLLKGFVQRRSHSVLKIALPEKSEYVLMCRMSKIQKELMLSFLEIAINDPESLGTVKARISTLTLFAVCCKVWNHPDIIYDIVREGVDSDDLDLEFPKKLKNNRKKKTSNTESMTQTITNPFDDLQNSLFCTPLRPKNEGVIDYSWSETKLESYIPGLIENSYKMVLLFEILAQAIAIGDRLLVFSQSLLTLDLIERFLKCREVPKTSNKWCKNKSYYRLDGSTSTQEREKYINLFNNEKSAHLFLISTRAGSLGINLIGANRIVIFDSSWNPCHDAQAACRIYRYGQTKPCYIYRLVCDNSLEKKIYDRQVNKQGMANRVVDEQNNEAIFTWREIHTLLDDLHHIEEPPIEAFSDELLSTLNDPLIRSICTSHYHLITRLPFEHESLLLDRKELKLSSAEKRFAFGHYKEAKRLKAQHMDPTPYTSLNRTPMMSGNFTPYNYPMPYNMSSGLMPSQMTPNPNYYFNSSSYPDVSQPLPPYPPQPRVQTSTKFENFESVAETLVRNGNTVRKLRIPSDLNIKVDQNVSIDIKKGEEVMIIQTQKGLYLRTIRGEIVSIKNTNNMFSNQPMPSFIPISNNDDSFGIVQPNLQCGGTVHCMTPSHSRASSTVSHPPEVIQLSDDDDDCPPNGSIALDIDIDNTQTISSTESSFLTNGSILNGSNLSSSLEPIDNQMSDSFTQLNSGTYDSSSIESHPELSLDSLLEPSVVTNTPYESMPDSTFSLLSMTSTAPSSQLNGCSDSFGTL